MSANGCGCFGRTLSRFALFVLCFVLLATASARAGSILYIDDDAASGGGGTGLSWASPLRHLRDGLELAADRANGITEIHVAAGKYMPDRDINHNNGTNDRDATFALLSGVTIKGGYRGLAASRGQNPDDRDISKFITILSGDLAQNDQTDFVNAGENSYQVVTALNVDDTAVLDGVTIAAGYADGPGFGASPLSREQGSGLNVYDAQPVLIDCIFQGNWNFNHGALNDHGDTMLIRCVFRDNYTVGFGAGLYIHHHSGTIAMECEFHNNVSANEGGGAYSRSTHNAMLMDCVFTGNSAISGGGMYNAPGGSTMIANCTFTNNTGSNGAAMYSNEAGPIVMNCSFIGNVTVGAGGGAYTNNAVDAMYVDCHFADNESIAGGGGLWNAGGSATVDHCTFVNNTGLNGGGVYIGDRCESTVVNCTFIGNHAESGGGISTADADGLIADCTFINNDAFLGDFPVGGAMNNYISFLHVTRCTFIGNKASLGGGAVYNEAMTPTITHCKFHGNAAIGEQYGWGGGLMNGYYTYAVIADCEFIGNTGNRGGAVFNMAYAETTFTNITIAGNVAADAGAGENSGGGASFTMPGAIPIMANCIIWGNSPDQFNGEPTIVSFSCVQGGHAGANNSSADPLFIQNPNPGDDGQWGTDDDVYGDVRLQNGSPCIDQGDNAMVPSIIENDLAGKSRFVDDPATVNGGNRGGGYHAIVDMGAYEVQSRLCAADVASSSDADDESGGRGDGVVNVDDLLFIIHHWGESGGAADIAPLGGDGAVNVWDLQAVLDGWGVCRLN